jgi:hypothetical protein
MMGPEYRSRETTTEEQQLEADQVFQEHKRIYLLTKPTPA